MGVGRRSFDTLGQVLFWSYANLAMADAAVRRGAEKYGVPYYMIRAKLYKPGLFIQIGWKSCVRLKAL